MSRPADVPDRLSIMPDSITIEDYANPDVIDMLIWRHVFKQRDEVVIRAWKRGQSIHEIGRVMGIGATAWRIIEKYDRNGGETEIDVDA